MMRDIPGKCMGLVVTIARVAGAGAVSVFFLLGAGVPAPSSQDYNAEVYDPDEYYIYTHENTKELLDPAVGADEITASGAKISGARHRGKKALEIAADGSFSISIRKRGVDLSSHAAVSIEISNTGASPLALQGEMRCGKGGKGRAVMWLSPGETDVMIFPSLVNRDKVPPYLLEYFGEAVPGYFICPYKYQECILDDSVNLSLSSYGHKNEQVGNVVKFTINRVWAGGRREPLPERDLTRLYPKPHLDGFSQWKFYDWPGKVKNQEDLDSRRAAEERDLRERPEPIALGKYWGWFGGPRREATGHFRVEKVNGKWWFVDPEGCLFLSQGFLQTRSPEPEKLVRMFRSWGFNSIGGRSGSFAGQGIPYCLHIDRNAPIPNEKVHTLNITEQEYRPLVSHRLEKILPRVKDDPYCIGVFINNEVGFLNEQSADVYFRVNAEEIKRLAPRMLYLGAKSYHSTEIAARYCDVVSIDVLSKPLAPTTMSVYDELDKPVLMGAFSCGYVGHGMFSGPGVIHGNPRMRGRAYELYCKGGYQNPNAVGFHMYTLRDNETWGGGIFLPSGLWNRSMVAAARRLARDMYRIHMGEMDLIESLSPGNVLRGTEDKGEK